MTDKTSPEILAERRGAPHQDQDRDPYLRDRGRVVHSAFFRRLQTKKQILDYYDNDFSRTRLTHSLEVAQISLGLCEILKKKFPEKKELLPDNFCAETIALAHDLGHPPNGHAGEVALNYCMKNKGGFEANAQTFRIVSKLGEGEIKEQEDLGLNLTRAVMLGVLKYPVFYAQYAKKYPESQQGASLNFTNYRPPKCIFNEEKKILDWVLQPFEADLQTIESLQNEISTNEAENKKLLLNLFASIMDLADDIAYGVHDFEDGVTLGLLSKEIIGKDLLDLEEMYKKAIPKDNNDISWENFCDTIFDLSEKKRKKMISKIVHLFISQCKLEKKNRFETSILDYYISLPADLKKLLEKFQKIVKNKIIKKRENCIIDFQLQNIIVKVFECLQNNTELLPQNYQDKIKVEVKERVVCDYLAGMTDKYLVKIYRALFIPETISIFDRL